MKKYRTLFLDIGNVILTNGWDTKARKHAAERFDLDFADFNARHALIFDTFEIGKTTLDDYIKRVVFYQERSFTEQEFKQFMFDQSQPLEPMFDFMKKLKKEFSLKVIAVSNEGRELMVHRLEKFHLRDLFDSFICSGFVGLRKPDLDIFRLALNTSQSRPAEVIYIDDRALLVEVVKPLGILGLHHINYEETKNKLEHLLQINN